MNLKKVLFLIAVLSIGITSYGITSYFFYPFFPAPECRQYLGKLVTGEEVTTFNFLIESKTVRLETKFNQPLQNLGMPSEIHYQFQIISVTQQGNIWRYQLKEVTHDLSQELEIESNGEHYSIRWINDRISDIEYICMDGIK